MCTVSLIRTREETLRLAFNRDELHSRPSAIPPRRLRFGVSDAMLPIDPASGGTWIAINDKGLIFALLNAHRGWQSSRIAPRSRGEIIPSLAHCHEIDSAVECINQLDTTQYNPFHLLIIGRTSGADVLSDGRRIARGRWSLDRLPVMFTSSGLGDELVYPPRRELFDRMIALGECTAKMQDAFHRHSWPDRTYLSVNMSRADARTVSRTVVEMSHDRASMSYEDLAWASRPRETFLCDPVAIHA